MRNMQMEAMSTVYAEEKVRDRLVEVVPKIIYDVDDGPSPQPRYPLGDKLIVSQLIRSATFLTVHALSVEHNFFCVNTISRPLLVGPFVSAQEEDGAWYDLASVYTMIKKAGMLGSVLTPYTRERQPHARVPERDPRPHKLNDVKSVVVMSTGYDDPEFFDDILRTEANVQKLFKGNQGEEFLDWLLDILKSNSAEMTAVLLHYLHDEGIEMEEKEWRL